MKAGLLTRLNVLIAIAVLTLTVGAANASPHRDHAMTPDMTPDKIPEKISDNIPVELALVFVFLAFGAGLRPSSDHFACSSRDGRARQAHRLGGSIRKFQPYTHFLRTQFWKIAQIQELR